MSEIARYTIRTERKLLSKFQYISQYEGRTANKQLEQIIKEAIADFENANGEITENMTDALFKHL